MLKGFTVTKARNCRKLMMRPEVKNATAKNRCTIRDRLKSRRDSSKTDFCSGIVYLVLGFRV